LKRKEEIPDGVRLEQHFDLAQRKGPRQTIFSWLGRLGLIDVEFRYHRSHITLSWIVAH